MSGERSPGSRAGIVVALAWLLGGAALAPAADGAGAAGAVTTRPSISLLTRVRRLDDSVVAIQEGSVLRQGDEVTFFIQVNRPTFVHLVWIAPNGVASQLFPFAGGSEQVRGTGEIRVPANPQKSLRIDEVTGTERILLIATQRPLAAARPDLAEAVRSVVSTKRWPVNVIRDGDEAMAGAQRHWTTGAARGANAIDPHPGPDAPLDFSRGGLQAGTALDPGASGRALNVQADSKGNAIASVTFRHLP